MPHGLHRMMALAESLKIFAIKEEGLIAFVLPNMIDVIRGSKLSITPADPAKRLLMSNTIP